MMTKKQKQTKKEKTYSTMQDSVKVYERNFYSNVLAIPVRYINTQMTRERQSQKNARGCKVLGCRSGQVRVCGI